MAQTNYKQAIDGLKWVRTDEELRAVELFNDAERSGDQQRYDEALSRLCTVQTKPPLRETGLERPVFYAFQARAAWEMVGIADDVGEQVVGEYTLHPSGQSGIGLDWIKLNNRIWIPADYLEARTITRRTRSILSHDECNCFQGGGKDDKSLKDAVIYGPDESGSSQAKIDALVHNPEWRQLAKNYAVRLLYHTGRYRKYVQADFLPVLDVLISAYEAEMKL